MAIFDTVKEVRYSDYESSSTGTCFGEGEIADVTYCDNGCDNTPDSDARVNCGDLGFDWEGIEIHTETLITKDIDLSLITGFEGHINQFDVLDTDRTDLTFSNEKTISIDTTLSDWKTKMAKTF